MAKFNITTLLVCAAVGAIGEGIVGAMRAINRKSSTKSSTHNYHNDTSSDAAKFKKWCESFNPRESTPKLCINTFPDTVMMKIVNRISDDDEVLRYYEYTLHKCYQRVNSMIRKDLTDDNIWEIFNIALDESYHVLAEIGVKRSEETVDITNLHLSYQ